RTFVRRRCLMNRPNRRFVVLVDRAGYVVGFSEIVRARRQSTTLFTIWHDLDQGRWTAQIQNPRLKPETISATHLQDVSWKCGYDSDDLRQLKDVFELTHPSRLDVATILQVEKKNVFISPAPRRQ
ncbi:MAG: hypothetical protein PHS27_02760, partial [Candidatus Pacebacteria bacterium]|nr:hypothetical protein [Candidatus Paceibacterota bacterium]